MNLVSIIRTNTVTDIPKALRILANEVEKDIAIQGCQANAIGMLEAPGGVIGDYDYQIDQTNKVSLVDYLLSMSI